MKVTSVKRAFGLAAAAVGASGAMMLAPAVANAATAHPAHAQTVSAANNVSTTVHPTYRHPMRTCRHPYYRHGRRYCRR
jgi:hypothetical protein